MKKNEAIAITIKELEEIIHSLLKLSFEPTPMGQWAMRKSMALQMGVHILVEQIDENTTTEEV